MLKLTKIDRNGPKLTTMVQRKDYVRRNDGGQMGGSKMLKSPGNPYLLCTCIFNRYIVIRALYAKLDLSICYVTFEEFEF